MPPAGLRIIFHRMQRLNDQIESRTGAFRPAAALALPKLVLRRP